MATVLRDSLRLTETGPSNGASIDMEGSLEDSQSNATIAFDANSNTLPAALGDLKYARQLASDIVESGSKLHELLGYEGIMRGKRERAL